MDTLASEQSYTKYGTFKILYTIFSIDSRNPKNYMAALCGLDLTTTIWGSFNLPMTFRTVSGVNLTAKTRTV